MGDDVKEGTKRYLSECRPTVGRLPIFVAVYRCLSLFIAVYVEELSIV